MERKLMQLRNLSIPTGAVFAPMAGLTDAACRHLMADHGAAWTVSEMASAKALNFHDEKSLALLRDKHPHGLYAIQLFGAEPESMAKAILFVREQGIRFDILDINMGCPAPKITGSGAGSRLLLDPPLCGQMVAAARKALGDDTPLTVKMRIGWDADHLTGVEVAKQLEANGADLIAVHGRTREQMYIPPIDTAAIAAIKQAVSVPVLANGDVTTADEALTLLEATGCDGVMIGRGALGDPWLFAQVRAALLGEERPPEPTLNQRMTALRDQIYEMCEEKGEWAAMPQARSQAMHYMKGLHGAAALRRYCSMLEHFSDVDTLIEGVFWFEYVWGGSWRAGNFPENAQYPVWRGPDLSGPYRGASKPSPRQFVQILLVAGQHVLDEILRLGAVHGVQGGHLLGVGGLKLAVAAAVLLDALDDGGKPVRGL